jgi:hypothetical protein
MSDSNILHEAETMLIQKVKRSLSESDVPENIRARLHFFSVEVKYWMHELPDSQKTILRQHLQSQREQNVLPAELKLDEERDAYLQLLKFVLGRSAML